MKRSVVLSQKQNAALVVLLCIAMTPGVIFSVASPAWLPGWAGAAVALGGMFGALLVLWRAGALRMRFLAAFVAALALAAAAGRWLAGHG